MKFFKNGCNKGDGKFLLEMGLGGRGGEGGARNGGFGFITGGWKIKSLYIVDRGALILSIPSFSNFCVTSNPHLHFSF